MDNQGKVKCLCQEGAPVNKLCPLHGDAAASTPPAFTPFGDRLLVKQDAGEAEQKGGLIHIPDSQREPPLEGVVVAAGRGRYEYGQLAPTEAQAGDRILFARYAGTEIWVDGEVYLLIRDEEVLGRRAPAGDPRQQKLPWARC